MKTKPCRRQHTLPQLLLKGFASHRQGNRYFTFLFRKSQMCEPNIENVGLTKDFYNNDAGDSSIDELLTRKEDSYAVLVDKIRLEGGVNADTKPLVDEFVNHLIIRTRSLRMCMSSSFEAFLDILIDEFVRPENRIYLQNLMVEAVRNNPEMRQMLRPLPQAKREAIIYQKIRPVLMSSNVFDMVGFIWNHAKPQVDSARAVRDGQLRGLSQLDQTLSKRANLLKNIRWSVRMYGDKDLILGDLGPIGKALNSAEWRQPFGIGEPGVICLPLSDRLLLVGSRNDEQQGIDVEDVNLASAELSTEFFVATQNTLRENLYHSKLGNRSLGLELDEMKGLAQQSLRKE